MGLFSLFSKKPQDSGDDLDVPVKPRRSRAAKAPDDEPIDPMLPEKKRARRRLIGATALVLAAVIGLPMIFDSEPKPLSDDIEIQIPSRDKTEAAASRPMPLPPDAAPAEPRADARGDTKPDTKSDSKSDTKPDSKSAAKADAPLDLPTVKPAADAKPQPDAVAKAVPPASTDRKPATVEKKPAAAEKKPVAEEKKPADAGKARFVIQVAAVSSHTKADDLQNRLKKAGIKSYSQKVSTKDGERYRIRVGPFGSREEADRMRGRLAALGLSGTVQPL